MDKHKMYEVRVLCRYLLDYGYIVEHTELVKCKALNKQIAARDAIRSLNGIKDNLISTEIRSILVS